MKNVFVLSSLILTAGYPAVVALSLLPIPGPFEFAGIYVAIGIVAFAFGDYGRRPRLSAPALNSLAPQDAIVPFVPAVQLRERAISELNAA